MPSFRTTFVCSTLIGLLTCAASAQTLEYGARHATLEGWVHDLQVAAWDRAGSFGGSYYDRGVFRYRTPRMDHEHDLDLFTADFTLAEDADFYAYGNGLRSRAVSVTTSDFAALTQIRAETELGRRIMLRIDSDLQDDLQARRLVLRLGYEKEIAPGHTVGLTHSLARAKADMDLGAYYRFENLGGVRAEAELIAIDGINNIIDGLTASPYNRDTLRHYSTAPFMFSGRIAAPLIHRVRGELALGAQPRSVANIRSLNNDSLRFSYENAFWFAGLLVEAEIWPGSVTTGAVAQFTSSTSTRIADSGSLEPANYTSRQSFNQVGVFALGNWGRVLAETWIYYGNYLDEQEGELFGGASIDGPYLLDEQRVWLRSKVGALTPLGLEMALTYQGYLRSYASGGGGADDQYFGFVAQSPNHRLTLNLGYYFSDRAVFDVGVSLDLDHDHFFGNPASRNYYDGIYLRLRANW